MAAPNGATSLRLRAYTGSTNQLPLPTKSEHHTHHTRQL